jgi:hypothetical protein
LEKIGAFDEDLKSISLRMTSVSHPADWRRGRLCYAATLVHDEHASVSQVQVSPRIHFNDLIVFTHKYYGRWRRGCWQRSSYTRTAMLIAQSLKGKVPPWNCLREWSLPLNDISDVTHK